MDAVFVFFDYSGKFIYHLGLCYIVANLRRKGYQADLFIIDSYMTMEEAAQEIVKSNPNIIGFSIYDYNFYLVKELVKWIKEKKSDQTLLIAGGPTATFSAHKVLKFIPEIDLCSRFAGEEFYIKLLDHMYSRKAYHEISGITYRNMHGEIIDNPVESLNTDLDHYPSPYLEQVIDIKNCQKVNQMVMLVTSRGCVFSCRYCNFAAIGQHSISFHSVDRVIAELKIITEVAQEQGFKAKIEFMDDIFTINRARTIKLCQKIIEADLKLDFGCQTRADCVDEEVLQYLYRAGCRRISYGLESGVPRILNAMGKVDPRINNTYKKEIRFIEKVREAVKNSVALKIDTTVNMIFGWPGETEQDARESLSVLEQMKPTHYAHNHLAHYAGTQGYMNAREQHKQEIEEFEALFPMALNYNYDNMPALFHYDLRKIAHLPNDLIKYAMSHRRSIIQAVMGIGYTEEQLPQVLLIDPASIDYAWMVKHIGTKVIVHILEKSAPEQLTFYYPIRAFAGDCYDGKEYSRLSNAETVEYRQRIVGAKAYQNAYQDKVCVELTDEQELYQYLESIEGTSINELLKLNSYHGNDYMLLDYCRFSHKSECPALSLQRMIVKNGCVYTCHSGEALMTMTEFNLSKAQRLVQKKYEEACQRRGCASCEVQEKCPKCMNTSMFGDEAYCQYQHQKHKFKNFQRMHKLKLMEYFYIP